MDNIAEGFERNSKLEFIFFLSYVKGSADEVLIQLYRSKDFEYITEDEYEFLKIKHELFAGKIGNFIKY